MFSHIIVVFPNLQSIKTAIPAELSILKVWVTQKTIIYANSGKNRQFYQAHKPGGNIDTQAYQDNN